MPIYISYRRQNSGDFTRSSLQCAPDGLPVNAPRKVVAGYKSTLIEITVPQLTHR